MANVKFLTRQLDTPNFETKAKDAKRARMIRKYKFSSGDVMKNLFLLFSSDLSHYFV